MTGDLGQIRRAIDEKLNADDVVCCPRCGGAFASVTAIIQNADETGTKQGGCSVVYTGECGHVWADIYAKHKGRTVRVPALLEWTPLEDN